MNDTYGIATDEELARLRGKIGERVEISEPPYLTEVTRDAIRHWRQEVNTKASASSGIITSPFTSDDVESHTKCNYMDNLAFTYVDRVKEATKVSHEVIEYLANN